MSITSQEIILGLISYYKNRGVDLTALLGDPTFQSMKVEDKVQAIKDHAAEIHANSTSNYSKAEKQRMMLDAGLTSAIAIPAILTAMKSSVAKTWAPALHNQSLAVAAGGALLGGALVGAAKTYISAQMNRDARENLRRDLYRASINPTTSNAVGVLASNNVYQASHPLRSALVSRAQELLSTYNPGHVFRESYESDFDDRADLSGMAANQRFRELNKKQS